MCPRVSQRRGTRASHSGNARVKPIANLPLDDPQRLQKLIDAVVDYAIYMLDADGVVATWNPGAERIKGYQANEIIGKHFSRFYTEEDRRARVPERGLGIAAREGRFESEGWRVRKDGTRFWAHVVIDRVCDDAGGLIGFAKVTRDVTERREAERKLEQTREALQQAQKMEALGQLTGGVAHDFNNILAAIVNNLELARGGMVRDGAVRRQLEAALQAAYNGAGLIQQMLVFARKQPQRIGALDLRRAIGDMATLLRRTCPENVEIVTEIAADLPPAKADLHLLQTSLLNLVVNSRDAMPNGGTVTIAATLKRVDDTGVLPAGDYVEISVTDTGTGMAPDVLRHALEPFFTTKEIGKGTGLGLSMAYGAVRQMGGDVTIESEVWRGTTVHLLLPAASETAEAAAKPARKAPTTEAAGDVKLILVEDDVIVGLAAAEMLEGAGYGVYQASRAEQALGLLEEHPEVGIVVTDIGLPGMNGQELAAEARRRRPNLKVLFITGYDRTGVAGSESGADTAYLAKPYHPEELFGALRGLVAAY